MMLTSTHACPESDACLLQTRELTSKVRSLFVHPITVNPVAETVRRVAKPKKLMPRPKRHDTPTAVMAMAVVEVMTAVCAIAWAVASCSSACYGGPGRHASRFKIGAGGEVSRSHC